MIKESLFYAKILLFGEYGIINDSMGLSVPYNFYKGKLRFPESGENLSSASNDSLRKFAAFLAQKQEDKELLFDLNIEKLQEDLNKGLVFDSNIPQGYGVGSSGALCASIYGQYAENPLHIDDAEAKDNIIKLKAIFGQMESYFHGKSSGIDPLICYLNLPLLIRSKSEIDTVGLPEYTTGSGAVFLINSGIPGETQPMVNIFLEKCKEEGFRKIMKEQFIKYNDECIKAFLNRDITPLFRNLKKLSRLVFENFEPMIPGVFKQLWQKGLETNSYYLKLCGSGGGGYILGFTRDYEEAEKHLKGYASEVIFRF